jgi:hypothetical protein
MNVGVEEKGRDLVTLVREVVIGNNKAGGAARMQEYLH